MKQHSFQTAARVGYAARGAVYLLIGGMALFAATGRGRAADSKDALATLLAQPLGYVWVSGIAGGLLIFAIWRFSQALLNADRLPNDWRSYFHRLAYFGSGAAHIALSTAAVTLLTRGYNGKSGESSAKVWAANALSMPLGQWLTGGIGCALCTAGFVLICVGFWARLDRRLTLGRSERRWVVPLGRIGFAARGAVFFIAGLLLIFAALDANPQEARGLAGTLQSLQSAPHGSAFLCVVAVGLFLFGVFQLAVAYYREIDTTKAKEELHHLKAKVPV